jgi:hypothetical protein
MWSSHILTGLAVNTRVISVLHVQQLVISVFTYMYTRYKTFMYLVFRITDLYSTYLPPPTHAHGPYFLLSHNCFVGFV